MLDVIPAILVKHKDTSTRIKEHFKDKKSHIYKHLEASQICKEQSDENCFSILDTARTKFQSQIKEGLYIKWEKPSLNKQVNHYNLGITV